jgi:hypothetical protein
MAMLVDVVVSKGEVLAAKPASDMAPPIVLMTLVDGVVIPAIKWPTYSNSGLNARLSNRTFGRLKGKALEKALKVVMENGQLNIAGEYGSIEISKKDFEVDLKIQSQRQGSVNLTVKDS